NAPVATVTVAPATASILTNATVQLTATLKDAGGNTLTGRTVVWSSNASAATVNSGSGLVTGVTAGTATITATSEGVKGTSLVTGTKAGVAAATVAPATAGVLTSATVDSTAREAD